MYSFSISDFLQMFFNMMTGFQDSSPHMPLLKIKLNKNTSYQGGGVGIEKLYKDA